ncbi:MAG: TolC family protein [Proteobacteria bacterium]|nr:TolC family protein [Pseudomonadota bacterium]
MALLLLMALHSVALSAESQRAGVHSLTLQAALSAAIANDPWLVGSQHSQDSLGALAAAAGTLPDPRVSLGFANIPTDTFDFDQEAMSQFKVGLTQMFPRGDSRELQQKQIAILSKKFPYERQNRIASLTTTVSELWLDAYRSRATSVLIESNRGLFEQLVDVATLSYSAAVGRSRQQDVIRAQLELTQLEDRLLLLQQQFEMDSQRLGEWLMSSPYGRSEPLLLPEELPVLKLHNGGLSPGVDVLATASREQLLQHPAILALEQQIASASTGVSLAKQKYKPEWGVSASYGYRDDDPLSGRDRSDFFSLGVSFDLPVFTTNRQDKQVRAAVSQAEAVRTQKWLMLRQLSAGMETARAKLRRLESRQALYAQQLLPQMREQADASLSAYTNDDGDFAEVVRARIAQLNTEIESLAIDVEKQKTIARLNYYLVQGRLETEQPSSVTLANYSGAKQ